MQHTRRLMRKVVQSYTSRSSCSEFTRTVAGARGSTTAPERFGDAHAVHSCTKTPRTYRISDWMQSPPKHTGWALPHTCITRTVGRGKARNRQIEPVGSKILPEAHPGYLLVALGFMKSEKQVFRTVRYQLIKVE